MSEPRRLLAFSAAIRDNLLSILTVLAYFHASGSNFRAPKADILALGTSDGMSVKVPAQGGLADWTGRIVSSVTDDALSAKVVAQGIHDMAP